MNSMRKKIGILASLLFIIMFFIAGIYKLDAKESKASMKLLEKDLEDEKNQISEQQDYITELTQQIENCHSKDTEPENPEEPEDSSSISNDDIDPYPSMYAEKLYKQLNPSEGKNVYLTFDDGPSPATPKVLDILDEFNAKATFFVVYKEKEEYAQYLSEIVSRGHTLALHSYSHKYEEIYVSVDAFLSDFQKVYDWVYEETGLRPSLFRFPGGSTNGKKAITDEIIAEMERRGFIYYDWNINSEDGSNLTTTSSIINNITNNVGDYTTPIVLMHDGGSNDPMVAALPTILQKLLDEGYTFQSLDDTAKPLQFKRR